MRKLVCLSLVLGLAFCAVPAMAQMVSTTPGVTGSGTQNVVVDAAGAAKVVDWSKFNMGTTGSYTAVNNSFGVLNNVAAGQLAELYGSLTSYAGGVGASPIYGAVYFHAPGGMVIGKGATIRTTDFLVSTAGTNPFSAAFTAGTLFTNWAADFNAASATGVAFGFGTIGMPDWWAYGGAGADNYFTELKVGSGKYDNIWIIGTEWKHLAYNNGIGASPFTNQDPYWGIKNAAVVTANTKAETLGTWAVRDFAFDSANAATGVGSYLFADATGAGRTIWMNKVVGNNVNVDLNGTMVWINNVEVASYQAGANSRSTWVGGSVTAKSGVNLQGEVIWVTGKNANGNAVEVSSGSPWVSNDKTTGGLVWNTAGATVGGANTVGTWIPNGGVTVTEGDVVLDGTKVWVNNVTATDTTPSTGVGNVTIGGNSAAVSVWTQNIKADNTVQIDTTPTTTHPTTSIWAKTITATNVGVNPVSGVNNDNFASEKVTVPGTGVFINNSTNSTVKGDTANTFGKKVVAWWP